MAVRRQQWARSSCRARAVAAHLHHARVGSCRLRGRHPLLHPTLRNPPLNSRIRAFALSLCAQVTSRGTLRLKPGVTPRHPPTVLRVPRARVPRHRRPSSTHAGTGCAPEPQPRPSDRQDFIEDKLGQAELNDIKQNGLAAHAKWGTWLYDDGMAAPMVCHMDGRNQTRVTKILGTAS